jgi:hypothetical protein
MTMARFMTTTYILVILFLLNACTQTPTSPTPNPTLSADIKTINWSMGNVPVSFWNSDSKPSAVLNLYIYFQSTILEASHIKTVTIRNSVDQSRFWTYEDDELLPHFVTQSSTQEKYLRLENLYTTALSKNSSVLFLGTYTLTVELQNGDSDTKAVVMTAPNSLEADGFSYAYSPEDYAGTPLNTYVSLPKRATVISAKRNSAGTVITIKFSVDDEKVYSGWVNFYNQEGRFLGQSDGYFRNFYDGSIHPKLNAGKVFHTDGT